MPASVKDLEGVVSIAVSDAVGCAVDKSGAVWCWGDGGGDNLLGPGQKKSTTSVRIEPFGD